jgi:putative intracellular protease/amidase
LVADGYSDPEDPSGYSAHDLISLGFKKSVAHLAMVENTVKLADVSVDQFAAVFLAGGQGPMYTFVDNSAVHAVGVRFTTPGNRPPWCATPRAFS